MLGKRWPRRGFFTEETSRPLAANLGTSLTAGTPAHTLSASFTELLSATSANAYWFRFTLFETAAAGADSSGLLNIYIGSAGNEKLWIPTLLVGFSATEVSAGGANGYGGPRFYEFPLFLPKGTRITAKFQSVIASDTVHVMLETPYSGIIPEWWGRGVECLGANSATSVGTDVVPGTTSEGTWTDIGTSSRRYGFIQPMVQGVPGTTSLALAYNSLDIGTGSAAYSGLSGFLYGINSNEEVWNINGGRHTSIPSGTLMQTRIQNSATGVTARDVCLYGVF